MPPVSGATPSSMGGLSSLIGSVTGSSGRASGYGAVRRSGCPGVWSLQADSSGAAPRPTASHTPPRSTSRRPSCGRTPAPQRRIRRVKIHAKLLPGRVRTVDADLPKDLALTDGSASCLHSYSRRASVSSLDRQAPQRVAARRRPSSTGASLCPLSRCSPRLNNQSNTTLNGAGARMTATRVAPRCPTSSTPSSRRRPGPFVRPPAARAGACPRRGPGDWPAVPPPTGRSPTRRLSG